MQNNKVKTIIEEALPNAEVTVEGDGYHFMLTVITEDFSQLNKVKRQQLVYKALQPFISSGELHAVTINALTPSESK